MVFIYLLLLINLKISADGNKFTKLIILDVVHFVKILWKYVMDISISWGIFCVYTTEINSWTRTQNQAKIHCSAGRMWPCAAQVSTSPCRIAATDGEGLRGRRTGSFWKPLLITVSAYRKVAVTGLVQLMYFSHLSRDWLLLLAVKWPPPQKKAVTTTVLPIYSALYVNGLPLNSGLLFECSLRPMINLWM